MAVYLFIRVPLARVSEVIRASRGAYANPILRGAVLVAETPSTPHGATITQQLSKQYLLLGEPRKNLTFQCQWMLLAAVIGFRYSRDEVLSAYLDHVYLGAHVEGMSAGAQTYFGKSAEAANAAECALLAGLIRSPSYYSPSRNPGRALERRQIVLAKMLAAGVIDRKTYERAIVQPLGPAA